MHAAEIEAEVDGVSEADGVSHKLRKSKVFSARRATCQKPIKEYISKISGKSLVPVTGTHLLCHDGG